MFERSLLIDCKKNNNNYHFTNLFALRCQRISFQLILDFYIFIFIWYSVQIRAALRLRIQRSKIKKKDCYLFHGHQGSF
jgi:hypothetical protein